MMTVVLAALLCVGLANAHDIRDATRAGAIPDDELRANPPPPVLTEMPRRPAIRRS